METRRISIAKLKANTGQIVGVPTNPRQWSKEDVEKLAKSIEETPELFDARGIIVMPYDKDFIVLGGNMRLAAAKRLKHKDVPCIVLPADTPTEKLREIVIKDNGSFGKWDFDALANEWDDLPLSDWGVDVPEEWGVKADEYGDTFELKSGDKEPFQQMTFTVADIQADAIKAALDMAKSISGPTFGNTNTNGNALYNIVQQWVDAKKLS